MGDLLERIGLLPERNGNYERLTELGAIAREVQGEDERDLYKVGLNSLRDFVIEGLADDIGPLEGTPLGTTPTVIYKELLNELWLIGLDKSSKGQLPEIMSMMDRSIPLIAHVQRIILDAVFENYSDNTSGVPEEIDFQLSNRLREEGLLTLDHMRELDGVTPESIRKNIIL